MKDLLLTKNGDLALGELSHDISITDSAAQAVRIRLLWFFDEWRFSPEFGVPYFEEILVKNPNDLRIRQIIRDEVMSVDEVKSCTNVHLQINADRTANISFYATIDGTNEKMEVVVRV